MELEISNFMKTLFSLRSYSTFLHFGALIVCCQFFGLSSAQCDSAINIGDYRRSIAYRPTADDPMLCDTAISETKWYRFDSFAGGKMPEKCIEPFHCGTVVPIWMKDSHPTRLDPGPKTATVCAQYLEGKGGCCEWTDSIQVMRCESVGTGREYFVYQLKKPPFCAMAYCAGDGVPCDEGCSWNQIQNRCSCPAYPPMTDPILSEPKIITGTTQVRNGFPPNDYFYPTIFIVECVAGYTPRATDDGARFEFIFEVDGTKIFQFTADSTDPRAVMDERHLVGRIGGTLTCRVASYWFSGPEKPVGSRYLRANGRWFGIQPMLENGTVIRNNFVVKECEEVSLYMRPSFPITQRPCYENPTRPCYYASYRFQIAAAEGVTRLSDCFLVFSRTFSKSVEVRIVVPSIGYRPKPFIWQMNFLPYTDVAHPLPTGSPPIFANYTIQSVNIEVIDRAPPPVCQSTGDPHITTFPTAASPTGIYYHIYLVGDFYLVLLRTRNLEIQVRQAACNPTQTVSCNCGIIAREGNCIVGINVCNQPTPLIFQIKLDKVSPCGTIQTTANGWKIALLSGIEAEVISYGWNGLLFLNIVVKGISSEVSQYDGLCSAQVTSNSECTTGCERYRVPASESFFNPSVKPKCGPPYQVPTCDCQGRNLDQSIDVQCSSPTGDYLIPVDMTAVCGKERSSKGVPPAPSGQDFVNLAYLFTPTSIPETDEVDRPAQNGSGHFMIKVAPKIIVKFDPSQSESQCQKGLRKSLAYDLCKDRVKEEVIIAICVLDCELLQEYAPAESVYTLFEAECKRSIIGSLDDPQNTNKRSDEQLLARINNLICPRQCSANGECRNGQCQCKPGCVGSDCSLREGEIPKIIVGPPTSCNLRYQPCQTFFIRTLQTPATNTVSCKFKFLSNRFTEQNESEVLATVSGGVTVCPVTFPISKDDLKATGTNFTVVVSIAFQPPFYSAEYAVAIQYGSNNI